MMKIIMFVFFMIPLLNKWWMVVICFMLLSLLLLFLPITMNYSLISYNYGMDMVSYWMILLTLWILFLMFLASYNLKLKFGMNEFCLTLILLSLFLMLSFSTTNLFMFYLWFECSMVPTLLLIFGWGYQPERLMAGMYLIFYTLVASLPMLIGILYINYSNNTTYYFLLNLDMNFYLYISMILAFLVKMPMFMFHFWLPSAHVEAPVSGSMILAGVLLKLGGYGLFRVMMFLYKYTNYNYIWIILSLTGSVIVGILCLCQVDIKSMIAYSSVSHMGLVIGGIMTCNMFGLWGSLVMMLGHGLCSSGLFSMSNMMYERSGSRSIMINKGYMIMMPTISMLWFLTSINNMSSPPSLNLLGEIMLINSIMSWSIMMFLLLALISFLSCCYSIYLFSITQHGFIFSGLKFNYYGYVREYMLILLHLMPLNIMFLKSDLFTLWI
uniref:NADH dehydrogenase subunit 4 n=1 Tax=Bochrus foveatus TaxID=2969364 RepID=UPI002176C296|nr:NADH dehydrogenase subunit 4 [Bochrus foveatus]UUJ37720.1 NADH dehydrogenase subunit 4 [Bochrus foveatus]